MVYIIHFTDRVLTYLLVVSFLCDTGCRLKVHHVSPSLFLVLRLRPGFVERSLHFVVPLCVNFLQQVHQALAGVGTVIYVRFSVK